MNQHGKHGTGTDERKQEVIKNAHQKRPPIQYAMYAANHATLHCINTTPIVLTPEESSRLMVATAAAQGV